MEEPTSLSTSINPQLLSEAFCRLIADFNISPYHPEAVIVYAELHALVFPHPPSAEDSPRPIVYHTSGGNGTGTPLSSLADRLLELLSSPSNQEVTDYDDFARRFVLRGFNDRWTDFLLQVGLTHLHQQLLMLRLRLKVVAMDLASQVINTELSPILTARTLALTAAKEMQSDPTSQSHSSLTSKGHSVLDQV